MLRGHVHDLSHNGMGLILEGKVNLEKGNILQNCLITPTGKGEIPFVLRVCHSEYHKKRDLTRIGGCIEEIDKNSKCRIASIIVHLEREYARRLSGKG